MLPIYDAISFLDVAKGGRTNPLNVLVNENGKERVYVLKLFTEIQNDRYEFIGKEVMGNILASEFSLTAPKAALITTDDSFYNTILDENALFNFEAADHRLKFATEHIIANQYLPTYTNSQLKKAIEIDTLFAYDNLIRNHDRGNNRTNLLMKDKQAFLIDHECALDVDGGTLQDIKDKNWHAKYWKYHIFYDRLRKSKQKTKKYFFNEFEEYLRTLNLNNAISCINQLGHEGFYTSQMEYAIQYLDSVRKNSSNFVHLLHYLTSK